jgi:hypothetical protein
LSLLKYVAAPAVAMLAVVPFVIASRSWGDLNTFSDRALAAWPFVPFWFGLASSPGYLRGWWIVHRQMHVGLLERYWILLSIVTGLASAVLGGLASIFTVILGILAFGAAGSAAWLLMDAIMLFRRNDSTLRRDTVALRMMGFLPIPVASYLTCGYATDRWGLLDDGAPATFLVCMLVLALAAAAFLWLLTRGFSGCYSEPQEETFRPMIFWRVLGAYGVLLTAFVMANLLMPASEGNRFSGLLSAGVGAFVVPPAWTLPVAALATWWRLARVRHS